MRDAGLLKGGVGTRLYSHGTELEKTARAYESASRLACT
jgi:hypothetical protein